MIGGFMGVGSPHRLIDALVSRGAKNLTLISNDTARPGIGVGKLISAGAISRAIVSHIGTNPETQRRMLAAEIEIELVAIPHACGIRRHIHRNGRSAAQPRPAPPIARCSTRATWRTKNRDSNRRWMKVRWQVS
jgi:acyl CoA:acetate/3-ketoacid CoA transferase